ncbi:MAG: glycosyltransferase [Candidatus Ratteibacteria bacterium]|nr:glycosyltransferase [Candidatus Ratteibacteria bacterium]
MKKKIAIFHNFMDNIGGAEIVGLTLARELNADFYSTNIDEKKIEKMGFSDVKLKSIGRIPLNAPFRQQAALWRFSRLDLRDKYDFFIIVGDWAVSAAVHNKPNLWYVHSPIREIWDLYGYIRQNFVPSYLRRFFDIWVYYNRYLNRKYIRHVDRIASNSRNTQKRVGIYLGRETIIINPPIETSKYYYKEEKGYWLSVNRLLYHKRIDIQMRAFSKMPNEKLILVGSYEKSLHFLAYADYIKKIKPGNVQIISWADFNKLLDLYADCKGLITTAMDEDFGMTVVEAMASGKPVIAANEGGYKETIIDGITGKLIDDINPDKLVEAIKEVGKNPEKYKDACIKQAKKFDTTVFLKKIKEQLI